MPEDNINIFTTMTFGYCTVCIAPTGIFDIRKNRWFWGFWLFNFLKGKLIFAGFKKI